MKRRTKKRYLFVIAFLAIIFVASSPLSLFGDKLLVLDRISQAEIFYKTAFYLNPFNKDIQKRLQITQVLNNERKGESEESNFTKLKIAQNTKGKVVLGANATIPVLMYHYIRINPWPSDKVGFNLSVTPYNFNAQMDCLAHNGYQTISLDQLGAALLKGEKLPKKPVVLTFDDGYADLYTAAFPILKSHGFVGTSFVITGFVGGPNYLNWAQINEMLKSGIVTFESHTVNHSALTYLSSDRVTKELKDSKNELTQNLGYPINWFAYPYGNVDKRVESIVAKSGYVGAFGTNNGAYHSAEAVFTLPRIRIGGGDSVQSFAEKLQ